MTALASEPTTTAAAKPPARQPRSRPPQPVGVRVLTALASLRLTVVLFALAIFLVFVGTLAQVDHDVWFVVNESYFRVWFASVEWQAFARLVEMVTKAEPQPITGGFWFPGGKLIGTLMFANLLAAHTIRFTVAARGVRLAVGLGVTALGVAATTAVTAAGMDESLQSELSPELCDGLWQALRAGLAGVSLLGAWWSVQSYGRLRPAEWWLAAACNVALLVVSGWLYANPDAAPDPPAMRILWQLTKCGVAAALLLAGCWVVFKGRAGIVLLHAGIGLLMIGELVTDLTADEAQMRITEGETVNYAYDIRSVELAVITDDGGAERVTVVPQAMLESSARSGEPITHPDLPFDVRVVRFDVNSVLREPSAEGDNPATAGSGTRLESAPLRSAVGVGPEMGVNLPSAYVEAVDLASGDPLGVWLVSASYRPVGEAGGIPLPRQAITVGGASHDVELRLKRTYKDYSLTLTDFRFKRYVGTEVPKDYSSDLVLTDPSRGVDRPVRVWMNNPLRYAGDTLYQSSFDRATERTTVLQVVTNGGWMIPYVSCMLVGIGMLSHFGITLGRFGRRRVEEAARDEKRQESAELSASREPIAWRSSRVFAPLIVGLLATGYFASKARPRSAGGEFDVARFAALPVAEGGRVKPLDTLARTTLQAISGLQEVKPSGESPRLSASRWMLDVVSGADGWRDHRVFRVENLELLDVLELPPRKGSYRYSYSELTKNPDRLDRQIALASEQARQVDAAREAGRPAEPLSTVQRKTLELADKLTEFRKLVAAFGSPRLGSSRDEIGERLAAAREQSATLDRAGAARAIPPISLDDTWQTVYGAELDDLRRWAGGQPRNDAVEAFARLTAAYAGGDAGAFSAALAKMESAAERYESAITDAGSGADLAIAERLDTGKVRFEGFFNAFSPFYLCAAMYVVAFVLTASGWLARAGGRAWAPLLGRSAMAVLCVTLAVHTFALVARVYISGRPPVTNLYSSAVFIGWAGVLLGVAFEAIYRLGIGSAVSAVLGFATLVVAHYLSLDGDTFTVLQAVLDTQFWLATHVVCVTLGYATVLLAGFLGIAYLAADCAPRWLGQKSAIDKRAADQLTRMTYGTICFALFFSFIGTVLGGLWADDSWGRFWGWDPKENGALIIVLWNALVLHARWGKMIGPRGLAMLAVGGNMVTTWSWFGVNELGVGLHAYGASDSPTAVYLAWFCASQLAVIAAAAVTPSGSRSAATA